MEPLCLGELRFLRSVQPFEYDCTKIVEEYFEKDVTDGWGLLHNIIETYGDPMLVKNYEVCKRKPWDTDDFGVIERRYADDDTLHDGDRYLKIFRFYNKILHLMDNFNIIKQYRVLTASQRPSKDTIMLNYCWKVKIEKAEHFIRNKESYWWREGGGDLRCGGYLQ